MDLTYREAVRKGLVETGCIFETAQRCTLRNFVCKLVKRYRSLATARIVLLNWAWEGRPFALADVKGILDKGR